MKTWQYILKHVKKQHSILQWIQQDHDVFIPMRAINYKYQSLKENAMLCCAYSAHFISWSIVDIT